MRVAISQKSFVQVLISDILFGKSTKGSSRERERSWQLLGPRGRGAPQITSLCSDRFDRQGKFIQDVEVVHSFNMTIVCVEIPR